MNFDGVQSAVKIIRQQLPTDFIPTLGIILGSGLGQLADEVQKVAVIPYGDIPGFHVSTVPGHAGNLVLGYLEGLPVACLQGRVHFYEGASVDAMSVMIQTLKYLGCDVLLLASACGSLHAEVKPGQLMLIKDHINFQGINPLMGKNDDRIGPRFVSMDNTYDKNLRERLHQCAQKMDLSLGESVYFGVLGPTFETPAEIRAFRILGGDVVGMSTVPEVILARHCGLLVAGIAVITNFAAGLSEKTITHEEHIAVTARISQMLIQLVKNFAIDLKLNKNL